MLAQVNAAITPLTPALSEALEGNALIRAETTASDPGKGAQEVTDLGVAISRSEIEQRLSKEAHKPEAKEPDDHLITMRTHETDVEKMCLDEGKTTSGKLEGKPSKSKKSRDEFDSLFDSLDTKKPSKKKKRKKGDEFDSLFSSLV